MAIQLRRGDYADFDPSQLLDGELAVVLENDPDTEDGTGLYVGFGDDNVKRLAFADESAGVPIATTETAGKVKPDGTTIEVDEDGTIHGADATPIATTSTAGKVKPDGTSISVDYDGTIHDTGTPIHYATSVTIENYTLIATTDSGFQLKRGAVLIMTVPSSASTYSNTASINVNSTYVKPIRQCGSAMSFNHLPRRVTLMYDGSSYWEVISSIESVGGEMLFGTSSTTGGDAYKQTDIAV